MYGRRIRELRQKENLTAKEFGKKFSLAESTISGYENETRKPDIDLFNKFADFFGVSLDYLAGRTDVPAPNSSRASENDDPEYRMIARAKELPEDKFEQVKEYIDLLYEQGNKKREKK